MTLVDYLRVLRRRWKLIGLSTLLVAAIAFVTAPKPAVSTPGVSATGYQATATLLQDPADTAPLNLPLIELYIKTGSIPDAVAKTLKSAGTATELANRVVVNTDPKTSTITITASDTSAARASAIANAFADATVNYLQQNQQQSDQKTMAALQTSLAHVKSQIDSLNSQLAAAGGTGPANTLTGNNTILAAQRDALLQQYQAFYQRLTQLQTQPAQASQLDILQKAEAVPVTPTSSSFSAPKGPKSRIALGALIGLLLGAAGALIAERFDTRLRSRGAVERSFRLPVVAEVPKARSARQRYAVAAVTEPEGALAEAFRTLRSALTLMPSVPLISTDDSGSPALPALAGTRDNAARPPKVIVVTSAAPGVGKTTTTANLAACLAEAGKSVLVIDCDFRHPEAHTFFHVENRTGLSDVLADGETVDLAAIACSTRVPGVSLVPAGTASWIPTRVVQHVDNILEQARALADVVVIDSPPLLGASEAADLAALADSVIVVAWSGRTTSEHAERSVELLSRVGAPTLGVALVTTSNSAAYISGTSQRSWPMSIGDHRGARANQRERSRAASRGTRGR